MDSSLLVFAADILGDIASGLTGSKIAKYCVGYSIEYNIKIPYATYPFPKNVPNKRTALLEKLKCFSDVQRTHIIKELCKLPEMEDNPQVEILKKKLSERTGSTTKNSVDAKIIAKTQHWLASYPRALKSYKQAIEKFENVSPNSIYNQYKRIVASIGLPQARFHDLRHSYAVAAIQSGDDIKTVQGNLGHATASFTLDVYGHVTDQMKQNSAARMEKFIEKVSGE